MSDVPPILQLGPAVLLQGPAVADAAFLVAVANQTLRRRDAVVHRRWLVLQYELQRIADSSSGLATSGSGNAELPLEVIPAGCELSEEISTREAALLLGISERQTRNVAPSLGGRRVGRALLFNRLLVEAEVRRRAGQDVA